MSAAAKTRWFCPICLNAQPRPAGKLWFRSEAAHAQHTLALHRHACSDCPTVCTTAQALDNHRSAKHPKEPT